MDISVITFSTSACRGDYRARLDIMARELAALAPDIVLLQDVFATADGRYNTATTLARCLGMSVAFHPARPGIRHLDGRPIESHSGLAVLARARIRRSVRIELHSDARDGGCIGQLVEIAHGATTLLVVNVQLSDGDGGDELRRSQVAHIATLIGEASEFERVLLGGDFGSAAESILAPLDSLRVFTLVAAGDVAPLGARADRLFIADRTAPERARFVHARAVLDRRDVVSGLYPAERTAVLAEAVLGDDRGASARLAVAAE